MYAQNLNPGAKHVRHKLKGPKLERDPPGPSKPTGISNQVHAAGGREAFDSMNIIPNSPTLGLTAFSPGGQISPADRAEPPGGLVPFPTMR